MRLLKDIADRLRLFVGLIGVRGYDGKPTTVAHAWDIAWAAWRWSC
jgi:hypothetical protein